MVPIYTRSILTTEASRGVLGG